MKGKVEEFRHHIPLVQTLFNPGLRDRHWAQISDVIGFPLKPDENTTLTKLIDMNLDSFISQFETVSESATKEFSLEKAMRKMQGEWEPVSLLFASYYIIRVFL